MTTGIFGLLLYRKFRATPQPTPTPTPVTGPTRQFQIPQSYIIAMVPLAAALNLVGDYVTSITKLPVFLDMMGTAVTAFTIGPWWGGITGVITNLGESFLISPVSFPFAATNFAGAIVWGYAVRYGWGKDFPRLLILGIVVAVVSSIISVPIIIFIFGGATGVGNDLITAALLASGGAFVSSVFISNIIASLADKIISTFVAVAIVTALPAVLKGRVQLAQYKGMRAVAYSIIGILIGVVIMIAAMYGIIK